MQYRVTPIAKRRRRRTHRTRFHASTTISSSNSEVEQDFSDSSESSESGSGERTSSHMKTLEARQKKLRRIRPGQSFGEMALPMNYKQTANVCAVTYVEMCILEREKFQQILGCYPEDHKKVLTMMLTSCVEKREIPFSWEEVCQLVATKRHVPLSSAIEDGDNLTENIVEVLLDAINHSVLDDSIIFGFQDRTAVSVESNKGTRRSMFRRKRNSRTGSSPSLASLDHGMSTISGLAIIRANSPTLAPYLQENSSASSESLPTHPYDHHRPPHLAHVRVDVRVHAIEKCQEDMFGLMHKLTSSLARLENEGYKIRKVRSESLLPGSCRVHDRSREGIASTREEKDAQLSTAQRLRELESNPQSPSRTALEAQATLTHPSAPSSTPTGPRSSKIHLPSISPRHRLNLPALRRRISTGIAPLTRSDGRVADGVARKVTSRADQSGGTPDHEDTADGSPGALSSTRTRHHHHHRTQSRLLRRGSANSHVSSHDAKSSVALPSATSLADQLWASSMTSTPSAGLLTAHHRRHSVNTHESHDTVGAIIE